MARPFPSQLVASSTWTLRHNSSFQRTPQNPAIEQLLQELELCLLQPEVRKSGRVAELLAEGFIEIGSAGRARSREQILAALQDEPTTRWTASEFKFQLLAPHVALVNYRAHRHSDPPVYSLRSSIWIQTQGQWQMFFHQATISPAPK